MFSQSTCMLTLCFKACANEKCLVTKQHQTPCLMLFDRVWPCLIKFEGHQTFDQKLKTFLLFSCLMGDVLFVWTAEYQTCLIRHVLTVWPLTSTSACLVTKQCLTTFGRQTFHVCTGLNMEQAIIKSTNFTLNNCLTANLHPTILKGHTTFTTGHSLSKCSFI